MKQNRDILGDSRLKEKAYSVPEGYFDELPGRIAERCKAAEEKRSFFRIAAPYAAMAASFVLIALAGSAVIRYGREKGIETQYVSREITNAGQVSEEDIINYCAISRRCPTKRFQKSPESPWVRSRPRIITPPGR